MRLITTIIIFGIIFRKNKQIFWQIAFFSPFCQENWIKKKIVSFFLKVLFQPFKGTTQFTQKTLIVLENVQISVVAICQEVLLVAAFHDRRIAKSLSVGNRPRFSFLFAVLSAKHCFFLTIFLELRRLRHIVKKTITCVNFQK